jgi:hypothetical protein
MEIQGLEKEQEKKTSTTSSKEKRKPRQKSDRIHATILYELEKYEGEELSDLSAKFYDNYEKYLMVYLLLWRDVADFSNYLIEEIEDIVAAKEDSKNHPLDDEDYEDVLVVEKDLKGNDIIDLTLPDPTDPDFTGVKKRKTT